MVVSGALKHLSLAAFLTHAHWGWVPANTATFFSVSPQWGRLRSSISRGMRP